MPLIAWSDELALGVPEIDAHHQHLVDLLNKAHDSFIWGLEPGQINGTITSLKDYADYHFTAEEQLMQLQHDPELASHQLEHQAFRTKVSELGTLQTRDSFPTYLAIIDFLLEWLVTHIKTTDRKSLTRCADMFQS